MPRVQQPQIPGGTHVLGVNISPQQIAGTVGNIAATAAPYLAAAYAPVAGATVRLIGGGTERTAKRIVSNAGRDYASLATGPFVGGYELGAGSVQAARGQGTGRLQQLGRGVAQSVVESAPAALVTGHPGLAARRFEQHPLVEALNFAAVGSVAGRTAGAATRAAGSQAERAGVRGALARAGSTVRPPIALGEDASASLVQRSYSKDLGRKAVQVRADRRRKPLLDAQGNAVTVEQRGRQVPVLRATARERQYHLGREADFAASRANAVERMVRDQADHEMRTRGIKGRHAQDLVSMVVEGTIASARSWRRDLGTHRTAIAEQIRHMEQDGGRYRHTGGLDAARQRVKTIDAALASPKVTEQIDRIVPPARSSAASSTRRRRKRSGLASCTRSARLERGSWSPPSSISGPGTSAPKELRDLLGAVAGGKRGILARYAGGARRAAPPGRPVPVQRRGRGCAAGEGPRPRHRGVPAAPHGCAWAPRLPCAVPAGCAPDARQAGHAHRRGVPEGRGAYGPELIREQARAPRDADGEGPAARPAHRTTRAGATERPRFHRAGGDRVRQTGCARHRRGVRWRSAVPAKAGEGAKAARRARSRTPRHWRRCSQRLLNAST